VSALTIGTGRNPVQLIGINAPSQPKIQFGRAFKPDQQSREYSSSEQYSHITRVQDNIHGINQAAPTREQTIWRSRLSPELQRQLNTGFSSQQNHGRIQGNKFPQLDDITTPPFQDRSEIRHHHVAPVANANGKMQLRLIKA